MDPYLAMECIINMRRKTTLLEYQLATIYGIAPQIGTKAVVVPSSSFEKLHTGEKTLTLTKSPIIRTPFEATQIKKVATLSKEPTKIMKEISAVRKVIPSVRKIETQPTPDRVTKSIPIVVVASSETNKPVSKPATATSVKPTSSPIVKPVVKIVPKDDNPSSSPTVLIVGKSKKQIIVPPQKVSKPDESSKDVEVVPDVVIPPAKVEIINDGCKLHKRYSSNSNLPGMLNDEQNPVIEEALKKANDQIIAKKKKTDDDEKKETITTTNIPTVTDVPPIDTSEIKTLVKRKRYSSKQNLLSVEDSDIESSHE